MLQVPISAGFFPFFNGRFECFFSEANHGVFEYPPAQFLIKNFLLLKSPIPPCKQVAEGVLSVPDLMTCH